MKTVIEMAQDAGFPFNKFGLLQGDDKGEIDADAMFERLVELVRADEHKKWEDQTAVEIHEAVLDEREACANVCDAFNSVKYKDDHWYHASEKCAAAIRARGEQ